MKKSIIFLLLVFVMTHPGCINKDDSSKTLDKDSINAQQLQENFETEKVIFAGMLGKRTGLYIYDAIKNNHSEFWRFDEQDVVEILYSSNMKSVYVLTAKHKGKKGPFPFIDDVKLFLIYPDSGTVKQVGDIGSGLQVFASWVSDSVFQVYLHSMDVTAAKYVEQKMWNYDLHGKKLSEVAKKFYLDKEAFPLFPSVVKKLQSPDKIFSILSIDSAQTKIFLIDHSKNNEQVLIAEERQKLNSVSWSNDGQFLIFSTIDITPMNETLYDEEPQTSKLFIYSLSQKKILKKYEGSGLKHLFLNGSSVMFDSDFGNKAKIFIHSLITNIIKDSLKVSGGCGLRNIPLIPDYEA